MRCRLPLSGGLQQKARQAGRQGPLFETSLQTELATKAMPSTVPRLLASKLEEGAGVRDAMINPPLTMTAKITKMELEAEAEAEAGAERVTEQKRDREGDMAQANAAQPQNEEDTDRVVTVHMGQEST